MRISTGNKPGDAAVPNGKTPALTLRLITSRGVTMLGYLLKPEIESLIKAGNFDSIRSALLDLPPGEIADALVDLPPENCAVIFRILPRSIAAATFEYLPLHNQELLLRAMGDSETAAILNWMSPDDRTHLLEELPALATKRLLSLLSPEELATAQRLLGYPEGSIGRLMTPNYISVEDKWTIGQALDHARTQARKTETLEILYATDSKGHLTGDVRIGDILLTSDSAPLATVINTNFLSLVTTETEEAAVVTFRQDSRQSLPVLDSDGVLVGIVTADDILEVAEAAATEDIQKIGGTEALDEPYLTIALRSMVKKRAGWLVILFLGEMLTATAMAQFEQEIARAVVLALFVPLIISSGGNSGGQAATLVIRAMALGELAVSDWWRVMRREIASGLTLGVILGTIGFLRITIWSIFSHIYGPHWLAIATAVALSLVGVVLWGTLAGSMLPLILKKLGFDPATSSTPFVATLVDVTGLVIYFTVAGMMLQGKLL